MAGLLNPDRQKLINAYASVHRLTGDRARGKAVFTKQCAGCHRLGDIGHQVGPDITSVGDKSTAGLLVAVLDPNRVVEARYVNYVALTKNGLMHNGVLASETDTSVTLLGQDGKTQTLLRANLDELASTGKSLMPEGVEKEIDPQAMADLFAHLRAAAPPPEPKAFAGNKPELVRPTADGSLLLSAKNAEIHGRSLVFEAKHENLGWWTSDDDRALWTMEVPQAGRYAVWIEWACDSGSAGKTFLLDASGVQLTGKVAGTGSWDDYRQARVGELVLPAGQQQVTFRAAGQLHSSALIDLRAVKLTPIPAN